MNVLFFGTPHFAAHTLRALLDMPQVTIKAVVTQPDRPAGRGAVLTPSPVKELALSHGIPVLQPTSLRKELASFEASVAKLGPIDIGVVVAFGQILPTAVLELPSRGCVNVHASLLPRWRGAAPIQRAIMAGDSETGVCLMQMDAGLDTGSVYSSASMPIRDTDTAQTLHDSLAALGASLIQRDLPEIVAGRLHATPQLSDGVTYAQKIESVEGNIDWTAPAPVVARTVRALSPHPGAFTFWRGARLKLLVALEGPEISADTTSPPGTVVTAQRDSLVISCGTGSVAVSELQLAGKKRMRLDEFLRGVTMSPGESFSRS